MRLIDLEEWKALQAIQPYLYKAAQHGETGISESPPHVVTPYQFLQYELLQLVISVQPDSDVDLEVIHHIQTEAIELFEKIYPILQRILSNEPSSASLQYIQKLLGLGALSSNSTSERQEQTEADPTLPRKMSLSDAKLIAPALTSFNKRIESILRTHLHDVTPAAENLELSSVTLHGNKRTMIDAFLMSLERHMACCKRRSEHHVLLQGAGQSWQAEDKSLFSLLLSSCGDPTGWQEIECLSDGGLPGDGHNRVKLRPLQSLCEDIAVAQCYNEVLTFLLLEGTLYKQPRDQRRAQRRAMVQVKTLTELIEKQHFSPIRSCSLSTKSFTIQEKRELSLNLGWCFFYLFDCPWTHSGWSADTISLLLSTTGSPSSLEFETPPYIRCDPQCTSSEKDESDLSITMKDSVFLALGKLLVEMELGRRITATECDRLGRPSLWLTLSKVLDDGMLSACDDYLKAIEGCLELHRYKPESTQEESTTKPAKLVYNSIVANLEKDLAHYRKRSRKRRRSVSCPPMDLDSSVKSIAELIPARMTKLRNIDAVQVGSCEDVPAPNFKDSRAHWNNEASRIQPEETAIVAGQESQQISKRARVATDDSTSGFRRVTISSLLNTTTAFPPVPARFVRIFDDLEPDTSLTDSRGVSSTQAFLANMTSFIEAYVPRVYTSHKRIKVCIIDTGIDMTHPSLKAAKLMGNLGEMKSFKGDSADLNDEIGHGTHMAELVLTLAPEAILCVAKVAVKREMPREDTNLISKAIEWALRQDADIISLSLGLDLLDPELDVAINKAISAGKIVLAAAGNDGNNKPRAHPGSNRNVLCIHASNGKGKDGGISPRALDNDDNFMTLGIAIPLSWKGIEVVKSGTSFATAVAAAIAADALAIISRDALLNEDQLKRLYSCDGMRLIFALLSNRSDNGYKYVAPWNLWVGDRSSEFIQHHILETMRR
ncbi:hypothetical protein V8C34DRAFT_274368 [Trichoderma compactum]